MFKDVLEYSEDELNELSSEELLELATQAEMKESLWNTKQLAEKTLINSLYGAMANKKFPLFNEDMAAAITGNGRYFIQKLAKYIEESLQKMLPSKDPYIIYGDTDSCYYTINPFVQLWLKKNPDADIQETVDWADSFEKKVIQPIIQKTIDDFTTELNAYNPKAVGVEREIISDCLPARTPVRMKFGDEVKTLPISNWGELFGLNSAIVKEEAIVDVSDQELFIASSNEKGEVQLKQVLNIQKKLSTKDLIELEFPDGSKVRVTEDHKIGVMLDGFVQWKEAQFITEEDDVVCYDSTTFNKLNCELYGIPYVNHGSANSDRKKAGKNISKSLRSKYDAIRDKRSVELAERVTRIVERRPNNYLRTLKRMQRLVLGTKCRMSTRVAAVEFCSRIRGLEKLDWELIKTLSLVNFEADQSKKLVLKKKYGDNFFRRTNNPKRNNGGFKRMLGRSEVHHRKKLRRTKSTPLHTAKYAYRLAVKRATRKSLKTNFLEGLDKVDKYNYNVDHIFPVMVGFERNVPPELIGDIRNLRVMRKMDNIKKRMKLDHSIICFELFERYL